MNEEDIMMGLGLKVKIYMGPQPEKRKRLSVMATC